MGDKTLGSAFNTSVPSEDCEIWSEGASVALLVLFCNASNVEFILLDVVGRRSLLLLVGEMFDSVTSEAPGVGVSVESSFVVIVSTSVVILVTMLLSVTLLLTGTTGTLTSTASD